jgi:redox-sensitive bicupin YhaK (pirin superfamily)/ribosomal protein S18 acetylase RimI-like enzyme
MHHEFDARRFLAADERTPAGYASFLSRQLEKPEVAILVAEERGEVIGYAYAAIEGYDYMSLRGPAGVLYDIVVDPEHRGRGVGRLLLDASLRFLRSRGAPRVVLSAAEQNQAAQRLFASSGFRRTMVEMTRELDEPDVAAETCTAAGADRQRFEPYPAREVKLGELEILRALPIRGKRLVGPWCFVDRFGPLSFARGTPMDVASHPHIGLQTVTWLLEGEVVHHDSLRNEAVLRPKGVNVMTSGHAIAHAERTPDDNTGRLNGVQLWTALLDRERNRAPSFQHVGEVPALELPGGLVQVFSGSLGGASSPAEHFSGLVGADLQVHPRAALRLPVEPKHEHAVLVLEGNCALEGRALSQGRLYYLGTERFELSLASDEGARALLIGGPPFPETISMWWNFVARTPGEIREARADWEAHRRFGDVPGYKGPRLEAPELGKLAPPNPVS